jgi:uncharacterized protein (TIGR03435 family)
MRTLVTASLAVLALSVAASAQEVHFKDATITRSQSVSLSGGSQILPNGRVVITNAPLRDLVSIIYDTPSFAIVDAPGWFASERFDIVAQAAGNPSRDDLKQMMRTLLAERFQLVVHKETRTLSVFELRLSNADGTLGPHLTPSKSNCEVGGTAGCPHEVKEGSFTATGMPIANIVRTLAELTGRQVIDRTNLSGLYDVTLTWSPGDSTFIAAVRDQLGLKLESKDETAPVLVIDKVARLSGR